MLDFIVENYYVILVVCILLIFAIIGYIIDSFKKQKYEDATNKDSYIPEEEIFIQKFEEPAEEETADETVDDLIDEYNQDQNEFDSK